MSDTPALPPPASSRFRPPPRLLELLPWLLLAGLVLLLAAMIWLAVSQGELRARLAARPTVDPAEVGALAQRLGRLEQRPAPQPTDLRPIESRLAALEQRPATEAPELRRIEQRLDALEQKPAGPDLGPLEARIATLEKRPAVPADVATRTDLGAFATRLDALSGREDQLAARQQGLETTFAGRLDALDKRMGTVEGGMAAVTTAAGKIDTLDRRLRTVEDQAGQIAALADKAGRIGRLQAAQTALDAGQPLGSLPGAPPSLTRFADARPPTEAALRLAFPPAARAAEQASRPDVREQDFWQRIWSRAQELVSLREGDRVIIGDPASGVLARARRALAAGDLAGAVAALDGLSGPPAQAMADWKARAQALLDARAALAAMAARA